MTRTLITGGGSGIGLGIAQVLARAGHDLVLVGRRAEPLQAAAQALGATAMVADITADPDAVIAAAWPLDHLVNNAGHYLHQPTTELDAASLRALFEVHAVAPARLARAFAARRSADPARANRDASIVMIASSLAFRPAPGTGPYAMAKAAMLALSRAFAQELGPTGLRCNAVLPGVVPTDMSTIPRGDLDPAAYLALIRGLTPLRRLGRPEEVGAAVRALIENSWITGAELVVDGGLQLSG